MCKEFQTKGSSGLCKGWGGREGTGDGCATMYTGCFIKNALIGSKGVYSKISCWLRNGSWNIEKGVINITAQTAAHLTDTFQSSRVRVLPF